MGACCGTLTAAVIAFSGPLVLLLSGYGVDPATFGVEIKRVVDSVTGQESLSVPDPVSFQWIGPVALLVNIVTGTVVSLILSRRKMKGTDKASANS